MRKLSEKSATVRVRQVDVMLAKEILEPARKQYNALFGEDAPTLALDAATFLPPPPGTGDEIDSW